MAGQTNLPRHRTGSLEARPSDPCLPVTNSKTATHSGFASRPATTQTFQPTDAPHPPPSYVDVSHPSRPHEQRTTLPHFVTPAKAGVHFDVALDGSRQSAMVKPVQDGQWTSISYVATPSPLHCRHSPGTSLSAHKKFPALIRSAAAYNSTIKAL